MRILIINGSPKGENSITLQTVLFVQKCFPDHEYAFLHVGQRIRQLEKDFSDAEKQLAWAELIVFSYPVYTFLVPSQLHRFIEIVKEKGIDLSGKYATQVSTSKHFYDTTAHEFIRENCFDLGLGYIRGLSADMEDLLKRKGQREARSFFHHVLWSVRKGYREDLPAKVVRQPLHTATLKDCSEKDQKQKKIVIVTDLSEEDTALKVMISRFQANIPYCSDVVNLREFAFSGGCLGCFHCASDGTCIYRDGFDTLLRDRIQKAEATVYAFKIRDHSMGYRFKMYDDRQFCNGHRTVTMGKPVGYLIDGYLEDEPNLRTLIEARAQVGSNYLTGIVTNEHEVDEQIDRLASEIDYALSRRYEQPANFYGIGGMKIFRDLIYKMRGMMREDHRFYKEHGFYDFPQKDIGTIAGMYLVGAMMKGSVFKKHGDMMTKGMLMPYKKVIDSL